MTKKLYGPNMIRIELDTDEVFPEDPGSGTPAMVYLGNASATYNCACGTGELIDPQGKIIQLNDRLWEWLLNKEDEVDKFLGW